MNIFGGRMGNNRANNEDEKDAYLKLSDVAQLKSKSELLKLLEQETPKATKIYRTLRYELDLRDLQVELVKLQNWIRENNKRVAVIFEGRDAAGKGGTIHRFTEHLNPRHMRLVALPKPTDVEQGQWYLQRYINHLPNEGEIVFFDRSWYNRAVVEPVMGFCSDKEYERFMRQVPEFEHMLFESGITLIKFWFSISKDEQRKRFEKRKSDPLKQWKVSSVDEKAQEMWDDYTHYKEQMFIRTHTSYCPWIIVQADSKKKARLAAIRYVLKTIPYDNGEHSVEHFPDPEIVQRFHRGLST